MNPSFAAIAQTPFYAGDNITVTILSGGEMLHFIEGTYFVVVAKGQLFYNSQVPLRTGMYGCFTTGHINLDKGAKALVIHCGKYDGMRMFGGPIEQTGRLKYIDGCTDSVLISPVRKGDPCLNHLHFPTGINQTMHTHPSLRIGLVIRGAGECVTPFGNVPLTEGMVPVVFIEPQDEASRKMATIRHNRARGTHGVLPMANIIESMLQESKTMDEICNRLQMESEEVVRLANRKCIPKTDIVVNSEWSKAWEPE